MRLEYVVGFGWLLLLPTPSRPADHPAPAIMLANDYGAAAVDVADYWVSEKYDGIRAYWDGRRLLTRSGNVVHAPAWFTAGWPGTPLDGELWIGRGEFEAVASTVRDRTPNDSQWRRVRFMVFDLPVHTGPFAQRLAALNALLLRLDIASLRAVEQFRVQDESSLNLRLEALVAAGAEGLMLHRADSYYRATRSDDLLKLKRHEDAEARVIGHVQGKGKFEGMLGSLHVETPAGVRFRLGTGFTDEQRREPPAIGTWVTYSYHGLTDNGVPRFARFVRVRE